MAVTLPRPTNHAEGDPNFIPNINQMEEALNQILVGTGWRNLSGAGLASGITGTLHVARNGRNIQLRFNGLAGPAGLQNILAAALPVGFRPYQDRTFRVWGNSNTTPIMNVLADGRIQLDLTEGTVPSTQEWSYTTQDAWPTTLPGTA
jgi:hypothetical protein